MPSASDELRAEWGISEERAIVFLEAAGYRLGEDWHWTVPVGKVPTEKELSAVQFLIDEWDFGGLRPS